MQSKAELARELQAKIATQVTRTRNPHREKVYIGVAETADFADILAELFGGTPGADTYRRMRDYAIACKAAEK